MAGPRKSSSLPSKEPRANAAKAATAPKPSLSSEFVEDSDTSGDAETLVVKKPTSKTANPKSKSAKPAQPKLSTSEAKPSKKRQSPSSSPADDYSSDSGSGSDSSGENEKRPSKKRVLAVQDGSPTPKAKLATARPVLAKRSVKPSTNVKPLNHNKEGETDAKSIGSKRDTRESSEDSSSGSESGSESQSMSGSSDKTSVQSARRKSPVKQSVPRKSTPIYEPPAGFKSTSISLHPASKLSELLAPSNLQGKQIWHITIPEAVPIALVKEVSTQSIGNGASVLEHHGAKYGLVPESEAELSSSRALLLPSTQTNDYRPSNTAIIKTLHLQQIVSLPNHAFEPAAHPNSSASASEAYRKTPRQQPEGLRMRYRPFGVSDDSDMESTSKPMQKAPEFRVPAPVKESSPGRKRKRLESNDGSSNASSAVKAKRRKQSPQVTTGAIEDPMEIDGISNIRSNGAESPTKSPYPQTNGSLPNGNETKDERKKRREKKKLKNQESPPKPAAALPLDIKQAAETIQPGEVVEGVPAAAANAVEGATGINGISPRKESKDEKRKHKKEKGKRKEMERASRGVSASDGSQRDSQDQMIQEIENAQRDASIRISTPGDSSPKKKSRVVVDGSQQSILDVSQGSQRKETKEERAKRREEKRRREMGGGSA